MKKGLIVLFTWILVAGCERQVDEELLPWQYDLPQFSGADASLLLRLDADIKAGNFGDVHSLMIIKDSKVIYENYYNGFGRNDLHPLNRASQSVLALLYEAAFADASLSDTSKIIDQFPEYPDIFNNIPQKDKIELQHLMEQTSGFNWKEWDFMNMAEQNRAEEMKASSDWVSFALSTPMIREPGMAFNFNSGHSIIMSAILEKNLPVSLKEYITEKLFQPLEIDAFEWEEAPDQILNTASGLKMTTQGMSKLGYLALREGSWKGKEVVSAEGIGRLQWTVARSDYYGIGRNWFRFSAFHPLNQSLSMNDVFFAWGEGGQFIFIIPHLDMVVTITAGNYDSEGEFQLFYILRDYILPSVYSEENPSVFFSD